MRVGRHESRRLAEDSIRIIGRRNPSNGSNVRPWMPLVAPTLKALHEQLQGTRRSFGMLKPGEGSVPFFVNPAKDIAYDDRAMNEIT